MCTHVKLGTKELIFHFDRNSLTLLGTNKYTISDICNINDLYNSLELYTVNESLAIHFKLSSKSHLYRGGRLIIQKNKDDYDLCFIQENIYTKQQLRLIKV